MGNVRRLQIARVSPAMKAEPTEEARVQRRSRSDGVPICTAYAALTCSAKANNDAPRDAQNAKLLNSGDDALQR
jgi:hypothetical protein